MDTIDFGHARRTINPHVPVSLAGYFNIRMWTGVLDDLFVQALALRQGTESALLLQFDLVAVPNDLIARIREGCAEISGLAPENVLFSASHTHTGPELRSRPGRSNAEYTEFAIAQAIEAAHEAFENLQAGTAAWGKALEDRFAFNRRYWMKSGVVITNPPRRDPEIDRPEGPIDPDIGLLGFCVNGDLKLLATNIVNHADTTTGCEVSADWPGTLRRRLEKELPGTAVIPLTGPSGNINHFDPNGPDEQSGPEVARRIGEGYAESALPEIRRLRRSATQVLATASARFTTGPREISPEELAEAEQNAAKYEFDEQKTLTSEDLATRSPAALKYFADSVLRVAADRRDKSWEVHALKIGDGVLVTLPGEPFVEYGLTIKQELTDGRPTMVATLNQDCGYIPNRCNYGRGGYETTPRCSPYSMKTGEHMMSAVRGMLRTLPG